MKITNPGHMAKESDTLTSDYMSSNKEIKSHGGQ
jgi:hypothetical protein